MIENRWNLFNLQKKQRKLIFKYHKFPLIKYKKAHKNNILKNNLTSYQFRKKIISSMLECSIFLKWYKTQDPWGMMFTNNPLKPISAFIRKIYLILEETHLIKQRWCTIFKNLTNWVTWITSHNIMIWSKERKRRMRMILETSKGA